MNRTSRRRPTKRRSASKAKAKKRARRPSLAVGRGTAPASAARRPSLAVDLVVPGDPSTPTGGYIYDRQILAGLAALGWRTAVHSLDASFPRPTPSALRD